MYPAPVILLNIRCVALFRVLNSAHLFRPQKYGLEGKKPEEFFGSG